MVLPGWRGRLLSEQLFLQGQQSSFGLFLTLGELSHWLEGGLPRLCEFLARTWPGPLVQLVGMSRPFLLFSHIPSDESLNSQ